MIRLLAVLIVVTLSVGCSSEPTAQPKDWYRPLGPWSYDSRDVSLGRQMFWEVPASKLGWAEHTLESSLLVQISCDDAWAYLDRQIDCPRDQLVFLVRGVYENGATGRFGVTLLRDGRLLVFHGALGPPSPMKRTALVVLLARMPVDVVHSISRAL
jgi:hypothetical protein